MARTLKKGQEMGDWKLYKDYKLYMPFLMTGEIALDLSFFNFLSDTKTYIHDPKKEGLENIFLFLHPQHMKLKH